MRVCRSGRGCALSAAVMLSSATGIVSTAYAQPAVVPVAEATPAPELPASPAANTGRINLTAGLDFASGYMFRGIFQEDKGAIAWPGFDVAVTVAEGQGTVKKVAVDVGMWHSLHGGPTGSEGPADDFVYESDFFASAIISLAGGFTITPGFTAYTSPNKTFNTVTELSVKAAYSDADRLGRFALSPYALVAFEIDGSADGGAQSGRYLELGIAPGLSVAGGKAAFTFPVKLGLSLSDYYEGPSTNDTLGFFDVGVAGSVPLTFIGRSYGSWALRGAVDVLALGANTKYINRGDGTKVIAQIGIGLNY